jgi:hypothetical protein
VQHAYPGIVAGLAGTGVAYRVAIVSIVVVALCGLAACGSTRTLKSGQCKPGDPVAGVYLPSRLQVKDGCSTVSGTVDCVKDEPDGDIHIRLRPDPPFQRLLTAANSAQQCDNQHDPHLVVEIIPQQGKFPLDDNSADKAGFITPVAPPVGAHVTVTGPYVLDSNTLHDLIYPGKDVKDWAEIHPAWNITTDATATPA